MGVCLPPTSIHNYHQSVLNSPFNFTTLSGGRCSTNHILSSTVLIRRSSSLSLSNPSAWSGPCRAASPGSPSPPEPGKDLISSSGLLASLSRFQETVQIFLAVLFWMSLFFWASASDGRNNGPPDKGSRFRK
ncbi:hypothetical protein LguiA_028562 [Lonicera macranthoides]